MDNLEVTGLYLNNPTGVNKDQLRADAPSLISLYEDPASDNGRNLAFFTPSSPSYDSVKGAWNHVGDHVKILAIVRPYTEAAVQAAVRHLESLRIPLSVRSGTRGAYNQGRADSGGVIIDMRAIDHVEVEIRDQNDQYIARVGGGILGGTLQRALRLQSLSTPTGWSSAVGYTGWLCGGGYGFLSTRWGLGVDNLVGARVVLGSGEVIDTDDESHKDMLWALRGAGNGNLGVVTELRVKTYPCPRHLAGLLAFPLAELPDLLKRFGDVIGASPRGLPTAIAGESMVFHPPGAVPMFSFLFVWAADNEETFKEGEIWLSKMRGVGTLALDTVAETPLCELLDFIATTAPPGNYYMRTRNVGGPWVDQQVADILVRNPPPNHSSVVVIHNARGKAVEPNFGASFAVREEHTTYCIVGGTPAAMPEDGADMSKATDWANILWEGIGSNEMLLEGSYTNFEDPRKIDLVRTYGTEGADRLRAIKQRYDPKNIFYKGYPRVV